MQRGFFGSLFDFSFSTLVTPRIIRVVYMVLVVVSGLVTSAFFLGSLSSSDARAELTGLILAPALFLLYVMISRVCLELVIVVFRIGDDVRRIADRGLPGPAPRTFI